MRFLKINLLVVALVVLGAANAAAYRVDMASPQDNGTVVIGDFVTVTVDLDTEGQGDIALLGVGVLFDESIFMYRQDLSSTTSYLLFTSSRAAYLNAASTCGGGYGSPTGGDGCNLFVTRSNQVQLDFLSSGLPGGVPGTGSDNLVSIVFEAIASGQTSMDFDFDSFFGSILQLGDGSNPPLGLGAPVSVEVLPEPSIVLLSLTALTTVVAVRRRRRGAE